MASKRKVVEPQPAPVEVPLDVIVEPVAPEPDPAPAGFVESVTIVEPDPHVEVDPLVSVLQKRNAILQKRVEALEARLDEATTAAIEDALPLSKAAPEPRPTPVAIITSQTGALVLADPRAVARAAAAMLQGTKASYIVDVLGPAEAVHKACTASRLPFQPIPGGQRILSQGQPQAEAILVGVRRWCASNGQPLDATVWCTGSVEFRARGAAASGAAVIDTAGQPALALAGRSFAVTVTQEGGQPVYHIRPQ